MKKISIGELFEHCIYSSIAHAVYIDREPFFAYEQSWDRCNYSFHFGSSRGTLTFDLARGIVVGAMRRENSSRIFRYPREMEALDLFRGASEEIRKLAAKEALMYLYDHVEDFTGPVATTGMWMEGDQIFFCEDENVFLQEGGEFLEILFMSHPDIKAYWEEQYELSAAELNLIDEVFRLYQQGERMVKLDKTYQVLRKQSGYDEMMISFAEMGITVKIKTGLF